MPQGSYARECGYGLLQELQPFATDFWRSAG